MSNPDVVIIGGGIGGLTAGAALSKFGKKVLLLEQHYIPGGCATTFKRKDFVMEVGLHEMDGLDKEDDKNKIFEFLGVYKNVEFLEVPELYLYKKDDFEFVVPHGLEEAIKVFSEKFPEEKKGIVRFFRKIDGVRKEMGKYPRDGWKKKLLSPFFRFLYPHIYSVRKISLTKFLNKCFKNEELKLILQANIVYYHDDPDTMSMIYFSAAQAGYFKGGGHFIKGGSQKLSNYLAKLIDLRGGVVMLGSKVNKILIENGKAVGVEYQDAFNSAIPPRKVRANVVIANSSIPTIASLLPGPEQALFNKKYKNLEKACSLLSVYIGFKRNLKDLGNKHYSTYVFDKSIKHLDDVKPNNTGSFDKRVFVFVDYGQIDSGLAPEGKSFGVICTADYLSDWEDLDTETYAAKKKEVAKILIDRLEEVIPGMKEEIEYYEVGTSKTIQRYTLNSGGTPYGYAQTVSQAGGNRVSNISPIENLFFASAWTFPGGGFTGATISGWLCAVNVIRKRNYKAKSDFSLKDYADARSVQLIERNLIAKDTIELVFQKPPNFVYEVGQYAILSLDRPKKKELDMALRPLSIASHPDEDVLRFGMRKSESSFKVSCELMKVGQTATVFGPIGDFLLPKEEKPIVFIIGGIGITPVLPMLKELERRKFEAPVFLFYTNKNKDAAAYLNDLEQINLSSYSLISIYTEIDKRLDEQLLREKIGAFSDYDFYIVGTSGFAKAMKDILLQNKVNLSNIFMDDFG